MQKPINQRRKQIMKISKSDREKAFQLIEKWKDAWADTFIFYGGVRDLFSQFENHAGDQLTSQATALRSIAEIERDMQILIRKADILVQNRLRKIPVAALNRQLVDFFKTRKACEKKWKNYEEGLKKAIDETELYVDADWKCDEI